MHCASIYAVRRVVLIEGDEAERWAFRRALAVICIANNTAIESLTMFSSVAQAGAGDAWRRPALPDLMVCSSACFGVEGWFKMLATILCNSATMRFIVTSKHDADVQSFCTTLGALYLTKPYTPTTLHAALCTHVA